jgi:trk system potassium uptake protein TrkA
MRIVFSGASPTAIAAARQLINQGHDIIVIEIDKQKIDELSEKLDCGFLHGDASKPAILSQVDPKQCEFLFCLTDNDQANIITSLLGRSMGFERVITGIEDDTYVPLCDELGLDDTIVPTRTMSQHLSNIVGGLDNIELSTLLRCHARFFSFTADKQDETDFIDLDLPDMAKAIYYYREDAFHFVDGNDRIKKGDEVVILTHAKHLSDLSERWRPKEIDRSQ